jgi:hypothetical protein
MGTAWRNSDIDRSRNEYLSWAEETFPGGLERDRISDSYSAVAWKTLAARGFFGMCISTELGGDGKSVVETLAAYEGLAIGCLDSGMIYAASGRRPTAQGVRGILYDWPRPARPRRSATQSPSWKVYRSIDPRPIDHVGTPGRIEVDATNLPRVSCAIR